MKLGWLDFGIISAYFVAVLGVGYWLKDKMKTSSDFLLSNRSFSHWITGIAFMSANLGALEVMGHTANGAKYGMRTNNWYWIGAIPAMVFRSMLGWPFTASVLLASGVVLVFVFWGGLSSSIYNEFLQFFLIVIGFLPLTFLGLHEVGAGAGWWPSCRSSFCTPGRGWAGPAIRWVCRGG